MKVREIMMRLREIVAQHPEAANEEVVLAPHGLGHRQPIRAIHLNHHGTKIVIEAER